MEKGALFPDSFSLYVLIQVGDGEKRTPSMNPRRHLVDASAISGRRIALAMFFKGVRLNEASIFSQMRVLAGKLLSHELDHLPFPKRFRGLPQQPPDLT
jgi:hypothetical protein